MRKKRESDYYDACWNEIEPKRNQNTNNITTIKKKNTKKKGSFGKVMKNIAIGIAIIYTIHYLLRPDIYPYIIYLIVQYFTFK